MPEPSPEADPYPIPIPVPHRSRRSLWSELGVVLAVGVVPPLLASGTLFWEADRAIPLPYWLNSLYLTAINLCTAYVVVYLIVRSGEPPAHFGFAPPYVFALLIVPVVLLVFDLQATRFVYALVPHDPTPFSFYSRPAGWADHGLMLVKYATNGFAEEVVLRAYLLTRFIDLLESRAEAVVISSALFAVYHIHYGAAGAISIFILGLAFGVAFLCNRNVWPVALAHMLIDSWIELNAG